MTQDRPATQHDIERIHERMDRVGDELGQIRMALVERTAMCGSHIAKVMEHERILLHSAGINGGDTGGLVETVRDHHKHVKGVRRTLWKAAMAAIGAAVTSVVAAAFAAWMAL